MEFITPHTCEAMDSHLTFLAICSTSESITTVNPCCPVDYCTCDNIVTRYFNTCCMEYCKHICERVDLESMKSRDKV